MKVENGRTLTFVLVVEDPESATKLLEPLWASFMGTPCSGLQAIGVADGNLMEEQSKTDDLLNDVAEYLSRRHLGTKEAEALLDRIEGVEAQTTKGEA